MSYWQGKTAVVTGASAGLGKAISLALAKAGANVVLAARGAERLAAAAEDCARAGGRAIAVPSDVTSDADVQNLLAESLDRFGRVDLWVNNAGRSDRGTALATSPAAFQALWELNFLSVVRCTQLAAPQLQKTGGHLVNIGSLAAKIASRYLGAYAPTKFALAAYSQQLRLELEPLGLHVLLVCPGPIAGEQVRQYDQAALASLPESARRPGAGARVARISADRLAEQILAACRQRKKELVVPGRARLLCALAQLSPRLGDWLIRRWT